MSSWKLWVGLVVCILLAVCAGGCGSESDMDDDVEPAPSMMVRGSRYEGVILLPGKWIPRVEEVLALEEHLVPYLTEQQPFFDSYQAPIVERLPAYKVQYWGVVEQEKRLILANFYCDAFHYDWTEQEVAVLDGGDCYFRLRYDPETGKFSSLIVNGSS